MANVPVFRGGKDIRNLFSSQGELKEPQLTAFLAYLLGQNIKFLRYKFIKQFNDKYMFINQHYLIFNSV